MFLIDGVLLPRSSSLKAWGLVNFLLKIGAEKPNSFMGSTLLDYLLLIENLLMYTPLFGSIEL
jgi:hypothetical protein